jgi:NAD(P)-dependent dehydrogenase (short-subunit alcohol dehydrogenase family)
VSAAGSAPREAIVVTGASTGIGAAAAETLAKDGFVVFAGVRTDADAARLAALHPNLRPLRLDVTDRAQIAVAAEHVAASGFALRGLVNNAGVAVAGPLEFLPVDQLRRQFEINVFGAIEVSQAFLPLLRATRGRLVFVGSISGRLSVPFIGPYSASKFALRALTDAMRVELAPSGIDVALVEPGSVKTPIWEKGRASRESLLALLPPQTLDHYGPQLEALFEGTDREERSGMPVEVVSEAIRHALTARKPHANYVLGGAAKAGSILSMLPASLRDPAMRKSMRLPGRSAR